MTRASRAGSRLCVVLSIVLVLAWAACLLAASRQHPDHQPHQHATEEPQAEAGAWSVASITDPIVTM